MKLLVSNCHTRMGYAVVCSLVRAGHQVIAAAARVPTMTRGVAGVVAEIAHPDPFVHEEEFIRTLCDAANKHAVDGVLPVHEEIFVLTRHRDRFAPTPVLAPSFEHLLRAQDKYEIFSIANALGIPTPTTHVLREDFGPREAAQALGFPFVVKPRFGSGANSVMLVRSEAGLPEVQSLIGQGTDYRFIAQQWVPGHGAGIGALVWDGRLAAASGHRRLREIPISGGTSTARVTFTSERLVDAAAGMLAALGVQGVAMAEFRVDEPTGRHWLLEINPRYWGGLATGIASGVDFPAVHVACAMGEVPSSVLRPNRLVESRWLLGEIRAFVEHVRAGQLSRALTAFRVTPGARLELDDIGQAGARAFLHQLSAYASNMLRYRNMGGHSHSKVLFFERHAPNVKA